MCIKKTYKPQHTNTRIRGVCTKLHHKPLDPKGRTDSQQQRQEEKTAKEETEGKAAGGHIKQSITRIHASEPYSKLHHKPLDSGGAKEETEGAGAKEAGEEAQSVKRRGGGTTVERRQTTQI